MLQDKPMKLRTLIVDEQPHVRLLLKRMIERLVAEHVEVVAEADSVASAVEAIKEHRPHIVFLDILLSDGIGFDVMDAFDQPDFGVIFVTGFAEYAIRALRYGAIDYLVKPVSMNELSDAIQRAITYFRFVGDNASELLAHRLIVPVAQSHAIQSLPAQQRKDSKISLPTSKGTRIISAEEILYCEAQSNYAQFYFSDGSKMMIAKTLGQFESTLVQHGFVRIHRSSIINPLHVRETVRTHKSFTVIMSNNVELSVSASYQSDLLKRLP
jgi:two-component system LytT family response regulator